MRSRTTDFSASPPTSAGDSLSAIAASDAPSIEFRDLRRRITYMMLFRIGLITMVMGATAVIYSLSEYDFASANSIAMFGIIATTYVLTIAYAVALSRGVPLLRLGNTQLWLDLVTASLLIHITGGAQSAYTFFFPLAIIGAATVGYRDAALRIAIASAGLFVAVSVLGWADVLPSLNGQRILPADQTSLELSRSLGLNLAAIIGVALLAINLGGQLQRASASLVSAQTVSADLRAIHEDIVRCVSSGLLTVDRTGSVLTINTAAADILPTKRQEAVGADLEQVLPGLQQKLDELGPLDSLHRTELEVPGDGDKLLFLGISVSPLFNHNNRALGRVVTFQNLTEMRNMEASVKRAERLAVIGSLAAGVAHEIRNPLAAISGSIELLRSSEHEDEDNRALMDIVNREIERLNGLIADLLDYANPRPLSFSDVELHALAQETFHVFEQDAAFSEVTFDTTALGGEPTPNVVVSADAERLRQVLWNLLRNAAEAALAGDGEVSVTIVPSDRDVSIAIADSGPGIPRENLHQLFDPFYTTKSTGTGLGLATVLSIVRDHGGDVDVDSEVGKGTVFTVKLPYTPGGEPP